MSLPHNFLLSNPQLFTLLHLPRSYFSPWSESLREENNYLYIIATDMWRFYDKTQLAIFQVTAACEYKFSWVFLSILPSTLWRTLRWLTAAMKLWIFCGGEIFLAQRKEKVVTRTNIWIANRCSKIWMIFILWHLALNSWSGLIRKSKGLVNRIKVFAFFPPQHEAREKERKSLCSWWHKAEVLNHNKERKVAILSLRWVEVNRGSVLSMFRNFDYGWMINWFIGFCQSNISV